MKIFRLIYLVVLLPACLCAQTNFHQGYLVSLGGDTIRGTINYREWSHNPVKIEFRSAGQDKTVTTVEPGRVNKFEIDGFENYSSYTGAISADKTQTTTSTYNHEVRSSPDTARVFRSVFLRLLTTGKFLKLYTYIDQDKIRFFIGEGPNQPVELEYHEFYYEDNRQIKSVELFKSQLIELTGRYSTEMHMLDRIQSLRYDKADLVKYIDVLNAATAADKSISHTAYTHFFAGILVNAITTHYDKQLRTDLNATLVSTSVMPGIMAGIDVFLNPNVQRLIFRADIALSLDNPSFYYSYDDNIFKVNQHYSFEQVTTSVSARLIYNFYNGRRLNCFMGIGGAFNYSAYLNNILTTTNVSTASPATTSKNDPFALHPLWISIPVIAGIRYAHKIEMQIIYIPRSDYAENNAYAIGNSQLSLGLKYNFSAR